MIDSVERGGQVGVERPHAFAGRAARGHEDRLHRVLTATAQRRELSRRVTSMSERETVCSGSVCRVLQAPSSRLDDPGTTSKPWDRHTRPFSSACGCSAGQDGGDVFAAVPPQRWSPSSPPQSTVRPPNRCPAGSPACGAPLCREEISAPAPRNW